MTLDIATLFAVTVFSMALGGVLLLFAWLQARDTTALAWWGSAFLVFAPATALFGARGVVADLWSIQIANGLMLLGYGLLWTGARVFEGRRPVPLAIAAGSIIWVAACQVDAFMQSMPARLTLASVLIGIYSFAFVQELWRGRHDGLVSRWPVMALAVIHVLLFPVRAPSVLSLPFPLSMPAYGSQTTSLLTFAPLLYSFALVFLLMALTKERAESNQRYAATIDPLTGIPNRRGFSEQAERMLARSEQERGAVTLLLFDLDRFKTINDRFGHRAGDAVLVLFTKSAVQSLRPLDLFGRIGGEEFVALLPGVTTETAIAVAERVRSNFMAAAAEVGDQPVAATVSVGTASAAQSGYHFDALYAIADAALYRAKQKGRNRTEAGGPPPEAVVQHLHAVPARAMGKT
ncbi:MAG: GGDEF domain-containing protein [Pseudorhodoplanes sp.]